MPSVRTPPARSSSPWFVRGTADLRADALFQLSVIDYVDLGVPTGMQRLEQALAVLGERESSSEHAG